ncbi:MAG TPA: FtsX-like permease family protein, partial [Acidobacteriota bacterium]
VEGDLRPESELPPVTTVRSASPDYFKTLGIPVLMGRSFRESDAADATPVVLLNHELALKRFGNENPVGKRITVNNGQDWITIIGVVGNVKEFGLDRDIPYQLYRPLSQRPSLRTVLVRTVADSPRMADQIRRALREVESQMAIVRIETMEQARAKSIASPRTLTQLFALFSVLALVIAAAGIGSMLALWVGQRTREIGIRMALGATTHDILTSIVRQGMALAVAGWIVGVAIALSLTRLLAALLFHVKPTDPPTYVAVSVLLLGAALLVCYFPARRAARTDPQVALRCE